MMISVGYPWLRLAELPRMHVVMHTLQIELPPPNQSAAACIGRYQLDG